MRPLFALLPLLVASCAIARAADPSGAPREPVASAPVTEPVGAGAAPALRQLVERAWTLSRQETVIVSRHAEIDARALAARSPFAGAPVVGFDVRRDLPPGVRLPGTDTAAERGRNEIEPGLSVPFWLPGQRDAQRRVLDRERGQLDAAAQLERLRLAGEVREAVWAIEFARSELRLQQARLAAARALEADVTRRVEAGDLAPVDRLLARSEILAAEASARDALARTGAAVSVLRRLTGESRAGEIREIESAAPEPGDHPAVVASREAVQVARARLELAQATRRDNPSIAAVARFDRDVAGGPYRNSVRVGVSLPLDTEARNAPRLAAASVDLAEAELALERRLREQSADVERARIALEAAGAAFETNTVRAAVAREAAAAIERAFVAGERGLPDVLRVRAQTLEAEIARDVAREQLGLARARLNQASGVLP